MTKKTNQNTQEVKNDRILMFKKTKSKHTRG